jgi:hypothetical protein
VSNAGSAYVFRGLGACNTNGTLDVCDVAAGTSEDTNSNGVPDDCKRLGDCNHDLAVDLVDYEAFAACHLGPQAGLNEECECVDLKQEGNVDLADFRLFQILFTVSGHRVRSCSADVTCIGPPPLERPGHPRVLIHSRAKSMTRNRPGSSAVASG